MQFFCPGPDLHHWPVWLALYSALQHDSFPKGLYIPDPTAVPKFAWVEKSLIGEFCESRMLSYIDQIRETNNNASENISKPDQHIREKTGS